jgi:hypothetical protein
MESCSVHHVIMPLCAEEVNLRAFARLSALPESTCIGVSFHISSIAFSLALLRLYSSPLRCRDRRQAAVVARKWVQVLLREVSSVAADLAVSILSQDQLELL